MATPFERVQAARDMQEGPRVQIQLQRAITDYRGVVRTWRISCMLPALSLEDSGLLEIGLESMATRLRRMLELSLCGDITLGKSWAERRDTGKFYLVMTATQFEPAIDQSPEQ